MRMQPRRITAYKEFEKFIEPTVTKALVFRGMTEVAAKRISHSTTGRSYFEAWTSIIGGCKAGEVSRVYLFVVHFDVDHLRTFVYAPGPVDNSRVIAHMLSNRAAWRGVTPRPGLPQTYPLTMFDIGPEIYAAVRKRRY